MAGFEVIVRPVVFPNIRPQPTRSLPPVDDPTQGQAVLSGGSGQVIALTHSYTASASSSGGKETERTFDVARIYQQDDAGNVNKDNFVDVEAVTKVKMKTDSGDMPIYIYAPMKPDANVIITKTGIIRRTTS